MSSEQNVREYYVKPLNKRFIVPLQKGVIIIASILFGKSVSKKNVSSVLQGTCER